MLGLRLVGRPIPLTRLCSGNTVFLRTIQSRAAKTVTSAGSAPQSPSPESSSASSPTAQHMKNLENHPAVRKFPKFMRKYAVRFANAPVSHATAFLILHEISAVAPLMGLWWVFHQYDFIPTGLPDWFMESGTKFIKVLGTKNEWADVINAEDTSKLVVEGAAAYTLVKLLLPVRIALCLYLMPWFARVFVLPISNLFSAIARKIKVKPIDTNTTADTNKRPDQALQTQLKSDVKRKQRDDSSPKL